jgi:hypothetical protein
MLAGVWMNSPNPNERVDHVANTLTILSPAIGIVARELASSLPQVLTYAAAIRCQASYEMEWTPVSDSPIDCYCRVAYNTPSSTHPKE